MARANSVATSNMTDIRYYARVKHVPLSWYTECTIYPEDILDMTWGKWNVPVTKEGLLSCIEEFVRMKEERA